MKRQDEQGAATLVEPEVLVAFLQDPRSYAHRPAKVTVLQTHASYVAMAPPFVYKVKKSVHFDFLDFSTLAKRRFFADREVELNRRLCPHIYLGVVPVVLRGGRLAFAEEGEADAVVEYAVKMRQLDERYFLGRILDEGRGSTADIDRIVGKLVPFYLQQTRREEVIRTGRMEIVEEVTGKNLEEVGAFTGQTLDASTLSALNYYNRRFLAGRRALIESRVDHGWIKDCHGDLHREHVHLAPDCVCIYDCIEFNDQFRYIDVVADVAFLAMDLDYCRRRRLSRYFVERMASALGDHEMPRLIDFYKAYRAVVRGKVESLRGREEEVPDDRREASRQAATRYFQLALEYAALGSDPTATIVMGPIASGKSTVATVLSQALGLAVLSSDRIRKELAGVPLTQRPDDAGRKTLYTAAMSDRTYGRLTELACERCRAGESVVLDATFGRKQYRDRLRAALEPLGVNLAFIELRVGDAAAKERLRQRDRQDDVISDARAEDFETLAGRYQQPGEISSHQLHRVRAEEPSEQTVDHICRHLIDRHLSRDGG